MYKSLHVDFFKDVTFTPKLAKYIWKENHPTDN